MNPAPPGWPEANARRRFLRTAALSLVAGTFGGCSFDHAADHAGADAPAALPLAGATRVAWVFSSGGPRGFVHVGVLKGLDQLGLVPDLIVGASVGSLVGTLRAGGMAAGAIETLALDLSLFSAASLAIGAEERFSGAPLAAMVDAQVGGRPLEQLPIRMACVATRQTDRTVVSFTAGNAGVAVQASSAIEGRFAPVRIRGQPYIDPDLTRPLPVREARALGAVRVLAIDASAHEDRAPAGAQRYRDGDLRKRALTEPDARLADLVLHPDFGYWVSLSREFRERAIEAGYRATLAQADRLRQLHLA